MMSPFLAALTSAELGGSTAAWVLNINTHTLYVPIRHAQPLPILTQIRDGCVYELQNFHCTHISVPIET